MSSTYKQASRRLLRLHSTNWKWLAAVIAFGAALGIRLGLNDSLPPGYPFLTFFPAVILTAFVGGLWPGIAVAVASFIASWYFFVPPFETFELNGATALALGFFATIIVVDLAVIHFMFKWLQELDAERERSRTLANSRDLMFKEMHHRVSNNIMLVASLIRLQRRSVTDESAVRALDEAANRMALVGKIHRQLHDPDGQQLAFGAFIRELTHDLIEASGRSGAINCRIDTDEIFLASEHAIPVGLILAELVANCLEHGFAGRDGGTISIALRQEQDGVSLKVHDDGVGLPPDFSLADAKSLGLVVARRFAEQLGSELSFTSDGGTTAELCLTTAPS